MISELVIFHAKFMSLINMMIATCIFSFIEWINLPHVKFFYLNNFFPNFSSWSIIWKEGICFTEDWWTFFVVEKYVVSPMLIIMAKYVRWKDVEIFQFLINSTVLMLLTFKRKRMNQNFDYWLICSFYCLSTDWLIYNIDCKWNKSSIFQFK